MYEGELSEGDEYGELKPAIVLVLLNFDCLTEEHEWHNVYRVLNDAPPHRLLSNHLELHFVELPKLKISDVKKLKSGECWAAYFSGRYTEEEMEMLAVTDPAVIEALKAERYFVGDDKYREYYEMREKAVKDYVSGMAAAKREGIATGIAKGMAKGESLANKRMALDMLQGSYSLAEIVKLSHLSEAEIRALATEQGIVVPK